MTLRPPVIADLDRLEAAFQEAFATGGHGGLDVVGYGEISCVVAWPTPGGLAVCKRLPPFSSETRLDAYGALFHDYVAQLEHAGVRVLPTTLQTVDGEGAARVAYLVQPALPEGELMPAVLASASEEEAVGFLIGMAGAAAQAICATVGFDAQVSNWALRDGELFYFDLTTPMLRAADGRDLLDTGLFVASLPWPARWPVQRFLARSILDEYFDRRTSLLNLLANLIKERLRALLPAALDVVNRHVAPPITPREVERYYRSDARLWTVLQRLRRLDRSWQLRVRRRPYPFLLPGRIVR